MNLTSHSPLYIDAWVNLHMYMLFKKVMLFIAYIYSLTFKMALGKRDFSCDHSRATVQFYILGLNFCHPSLKVYPPQT